MASLYFILTGKHIEEEGKDVKVTNSNFLFFQFSIQLSECRFHGHVAICKAFLSNTATIKEFISKGHISSGMKCGTHFLIYFSRKNIYNTKHFQVINNSPVYIREHSLLLPS